MLDLEFKKEFNGLDNDISHIDSRLDKINNNIVLLQTNVDRLTQLILNTTIVQDKTRFYSVQTEVLRTLALYNDNYQRLLDLKWKYRSEHDDFKLKSAKFTEIDLKRNIQDSDISYNNVIQSLNKLADSLSSNSNLTDSQKFQLNFNKDEEI